MNAYQVILTEANRIGWPKSYSTDLTTYDKARLAMPDAPKRFGWIITETATYLLDPRMQIVHLEGMLRHFAGECGRVRHYVWDGERLDLVTFDAFEDQLRAWRDEERETRSVGY